MKHKAIGQRVIHVTQDNINDGVQRKSGACAIMEAILDKCPTATYISVALNGIGWSNPATGKRVSFPLPPKGALFIDQWDRDRSSVKPVTLFLEHGIEFSMGWKKGRKASDRKGVKTAAPTGRKRLHYTKNRTRFGACEVGIGPA